jgi:hypothetical protein
VFAHIDKLSKRLFDDAETDETHIIVGGEYRLMKKTFFVRL